MSYNLTKFPNLDVDWWIHEHTDREATPELVWIDLETGGLDPTVDPIYEVGVMVTDMLGRIVPGGVYHSYVMNMAPEEPNEIVLNMHNESGLWADLRETRLGEQQPPKRVLDTKLQWWLNSHLDGHKAELAGSSVHFDREFLKRHLPLTHGVLHYRNVEISGVGIMAQRLAKYKPVESGWKVHRSLPDLIDSIEYYKTLADKFFIQTDLRDLLGEIAKVQQGLATGYYTERSALEIILGNANRIKASQEVTA